MQDLHAQIHQRIHAFCIKPVLQEILKTDEQPEIYIHTHLDPTFPLLPTPQKKIKILYYIMQVIDGAIFFPLLLRKCSV